MPACACAYTAAAAADVCCTCAGLRPDGLVGDYVEAHACSKGGPVAVQQRASRDSQPGGNLCYSMVPIVCHFTNQFKGAKNRVVQESGRGCTCAGGHGGDQLPCGKQHQVAAQESAQTQVAASIRVLTHLVTQKVDPLRSRWQLAIRNRSIPLGPLLYVVCP